MSKRDLIRNIIIIGILGLVLLTLRLFVFQPLWVSDQMANASVKKDDLVLATKKGKIDRTDLVLYHVKEKQYLGRVIAIESDEVSYVDDVFYLNGVATAEPYLDKMKTKHLAAPSGDYFTNDFFSRELKGTKAGKVPSHSYLVLNDDRNNTKDSREFGYIQADQIEGVVDFRLYPLNKFGFIKEEE
ncbi:signal peptidase I [Streptococcus xiaochunlingii]|jgi:signal peptidase I|uniref:signal peptidase I n=1 Tax=Streptococcus xiaochunlingii TaxID=2589788 RepID=UPI002554F9BE|nr:signal peptidase I [Streptococcus xiaochunlingii]MDK8386030.1 signal peptidase I [Streptococcus xiaochunlingii]MDK8778218.1 signal peptidase I [Streptococcus xiaochunlingii]